MAMTKKDFEILATHLGKAMSTHYDDDGRPAPEAMLQSVCDACKEINPKFNEDKFCDWIRERAYATYDGVH